MLEPVIDSNPFSKLREVQFVSNMTAMMNTSIVKPGRSTRDGVWELMVHECCLRVAGIDEIS